ncbi:MAG: Mrp/NBP35 family ATP-binding protein [Spirochaetes bacterium]|nr:Mrp/NBP35 family ATP-binding protein [Spirochaetota bacterium]
MEKPTEAQQDREAGEKRLKENLKRIKHVVLVISGKGGVGKTTVAVNLAYSLSQGGSKTGILDIDFHGPNIAKMLGIEGKSLLATSEGITPHPVTPTLSAVSLALILQEQDRPVIWRGPLKMGTIRQLLSDVYWGDLDYLIIDSPPGTGDEPLSVCQLIPDLDGVIVVTTPQEVAILDARKSVMFAKEVNVPVIGVIENMSGLTCPHCGGKIDLFSTGGGEKAAYELGVRFLGRIPIEPEMVPLADAGKPFIHFRKESETAKLMDRIVDEIKNSLKEDE